MGNLITFGDTPEKETPGRFKTRKIPMDLFNAQLKYWDSLDTIDRACISYYVTAENGYEKVNHYLRTHENIPINELGDGFPYLYIRDITYTILNIITNAPKTTEEITVWRGTGGSRCDTTKQYRVTGILSTSLSQAMAFEFARTKENRILEEFIIPPNTPMLMPIPHIEWENECIFLHGSVFSCEEITEIEVYKKPFPLYKHKLLSSPVHIYPIYGPVWRGMADLVKFEEENLHISKINKCLSEFKDVPYILLTQTVRKLRKPVTVTGVYNHFDKQEFEFVLDKLFPRFIKFSCECPRCTKEQA